MYLETIYVLLEKKSKVRAIDVGEYMGFSKPSVSRAVGILKNGGYVISGEDGCLSLTEDGLSVAKKIYDRHRLLSRCLMSIGVGEKTALEDACRIEHVISDETFCALKRHFELREEQNEAE